MNASIRPARALMRRPSAAFHNALVHGVREEVDLDRLFAEHGEIAEGLRWCGLEVTVLEPLAGAADACFVEDRAVVLGDRALITRSAVPSRAQEADSVASALGAHLDLVRMEAGTLDGGDVLRVGQELWVGRSARTDQTGAEILRDFAAADGLTVRAIDVRGLHLKCVCSAPAEDLVVIAEGYGLEAYVSRSVRVVRIPEDEAYAANTVGVGGRVLVAAGYPAAAERLEAAGLVVRVASNGEFAKRDGSLTCLSVLF